MMESATLTSPSTAAVAYGQVECLNCGRMLARASKNLQDGAVRLGRTPDGELNVEIRGGLRLRCTRCGGHAYVEFEPAV